jgi:hypothetical protein
LSPGFVPSASASKTCVTRSDAAAAAARVAGVDVRVVAVVGEVEPAGEVEDEHDVVDRVGGLEHPHVHEDLAPTEVEVGDDPRGEHVRVGAHLAGAVPDLLGGHRRVDLAQQLRPAVPRVEVGQRDVGVDGEELRLLHGAGGALEVELVAGLADPGVGLEEVRVAVRGGHRGVSVLRP